MRLIVFSLALFSCVPARADPGPQPPCAANPTPPYPDLEHSPSFHVWDRTTIGRDWTPPPCLSWTAPGFASLITTTARFHYTSGVEDLLTRVGAISKLTAIRYWSTTRQHWTPLIVSASALTAPAGAHRRADFSLSELAPGSSVYFQQSDNTSGKATYRLRILTVTPDRLIFATENITAMHYFLVTIFPPHEFQAIYFLDRESPEVWRFYSLGRTGKDTNGLANGHDASTINRAMAFFRYLAGIPTDQDPPAAR